MPRLCVLIAVVCLSAGCLDKPTAPGGQAATPTVVPTREEFRAKVMGKTPDEVITAVGKPDSTQESGGNQNWYYEKRSRDPITGNVDRSAQVVFEGGRVVRVNF
jgi:outer membrane protein assembly factor BamE (lipoprotein component of BamABCDE complex)